MIAKDLRSGVEQLGNMIADASSIVPFTGAGISTECGIPDFRSPGGLWTRNRPIAFDEFVSSPDARDEAWRHTGEPFTGERMLKLMDGPYMINGKPRRIDMGFIQPPPGNTGYRDTNRRGREGIRDYMAYIAVGFSGGNPTWSTGKVVSAVGGQLRTYSVP